MSCYVALAIAFEMHICGEHTHSENRFGNTHIAIIPRCMYLYVYLA